MTISQYLEGDGRKYRYVGTIWGPECDTDTGANLAAWLYRSGYGKEEMVDIPYQDGWFLSWNGDIFYKGPSIRERVLVLGE